jgi:hypothetical protein
MADYIRPTPRNPILGLLSDALTGGVEWMRSPQRAQQMQGIGGLLAETGIPATVERMSYGEPLTKGRGMTTRLRPEAEAALMTLAPEAVPIGRAAMAGIRATKGLPVGASTVYHGSPYRFQRFDPTKIGSGEGAQAYGYGHYVAESPGVAEDYRRALAGNKLTFANDAARKSATKLMPFGFEDPTAVIKSAVGLNNDVASAIKTLRGSYDKDPDLKAHANYLADLLESGAVRSERAGHVYTIDLPDPAIARMLDWDKPLSEQKNIKELLTPESMGLTLRSPEGGGFMAYLGASGKPLGVQIKGVTPENFRSKWMDRLSEMGDLEGGASRAFGYLGGTSSDLAPTVANAMRQAGIPGIRYLDQGSRGAGQGTSNFVVFPGEEDLLRILSVEGGLLAP